VANTPEQKQAEPEKKKKAKGPIRFEAIVPFAIIVALIAAYFTLFFDGHLKSGIEWGATYGNGAEVNVEKVKTSFWDASFDLYGLQSTNPQQPTHNRFAIGQVSFKALWDALLRAKLVVENASVTGIEVNTKRDRPGRVLPPPTESESKLLRLAKEKIAGTALGDIAQVLEGMDPTQKIKDIGNDLKSLARVTQLQGQLTQKEQEWKKTLDQIPGPKEFDALQARVNAVSLDGINNPQAALARVNEVKGILGEADSKVKTVQVTAENLSRDVNGFGSSIAEVDKLAKQDLSDLEGRLKLPRLDAKSIAEQLFGDAILGKVGNMEKYVAMARDYMPPKKEDGEQAPVRPPRGEGKTYQFPVRGGYPAFWVKQTVVSSTGSNSAAGGDVTGRLLDLSSSQAQTGKPWVIDLKGDFPKQDVRGLIADIVVDHRTSDPVETIRASVASFPVPAQMFSQSDSLKFGINQAVGKAGIQGEMRGGRFKLVFDNEFSKVDYNVSASSKILDSTLKSILASLPTFNLRAQVEGTLADLNIGIESNLATAIERGLGKEVQAKLAEARAKLNSMIQAKIDKPKKELTAQFDATRTAVTSQVDSRKKQAEAVVAQAQGKIQEIQKRAAAPQQKAVEGLKKKLPFGR
jgi:uncharacterized protein (TIGR03545 family)